MNHPIAEEEWFAYLEGAMPESNRARLERHMHSCPTCQETGDLLRAVDDAMISIGASLRQSVIVSHSAIAEAKHAALTRLGGDSSMPLRLGSLYLLLAPMCGMGTSTRAIRAAAHRVSARSPQLLEERMWPGFVGHLHVIVAALCGEPAARLVSERGMSLQQEAA
jgi:hypothetical protein